MLSFTLLGTVTLALGNAPASATMQSSPVEQDYVNRINQLRSSLGLSVLIVDPELSALARQHTPEMTSAGRLFHTIDLTAGVTSNWQTLGENVGMGSNTDLVWNAFLNSPPHYKHLTDPAFTHVGTGVLVDAIGIQWTTHRFMQLASPAPVRTVFPTVPPTIPNPTTPPNTAPSHPPIAPRPAPPPTLVATTTSLPPPVPPTDPPTSTVPVPESAPDAGTIAPAIAAPTTTHRQQPTHPIPDQSDVSGRSISSAELPAFPAPLFLSLLVLLGAFLAKSRSPDGAALQSHGGRLSSTHPWVGRRTS